MSNILPAGAPACARTSTRLGQGPSQPIVRPVAMSPRQDCRQPLLWDYFLLARQIGIGAAVTRRPLPHHRAYGSVHGGSSWLR